VTPGKYDLALYRGDTHAFRVVLWDDGAQTIPFDLTGASVQAEWRAKPVGSQVGNLVATGTLPNVIDVQCTLTVEKLRHQAESTVWLPGAAIHAAAVDEDMYAAIDLLADKLDEQVRRYKGKQRDPQAARHRHGGELSP
jgi:ribosome-associated translation inhibitor RaiA